MQLWRNFWRNMLGNMQLEMKLSWFVASLDDILLVKFIHCTLWKQNTIRLVSMEISVFKFSLSWCVWALPWIFLSSDLVLGWANMKYNSFRILIVALYNLHDIVKYNLFQEDTSRNHCEIQFGSLLLKLSVLIFGFLSAGWFVFGTSDWWCS